MDDHSHSSCVKDAKPKAAPDSHFVEVPDVRSEEHSDTLIVGMGTLAITITDDLYPDCICHDAKLGPIRKTKSVLDAVFPSEEKSTNALPSVAPGDSENWKIHARAAEGNKASCCEAIAHLLMGEVNSSTLKGPELGETAAMVGAH